MKLLLNGGGSNEDLVLTMTKLNELIDHSKPLLYIPLAMDEEEHPYDSCLEWFKSQLTNVEISKDGYITNGYRIKSIIATNFRRWATERLKEYMIKGFTMDGERLKKLGGGNYWKELLDRIRVMLASN